MRVPNLMAKNRLTLTLPIIILIAVFFIGYYFYYIPTNKETVHKNGFLILQNIKASILEKNNDYQNLYKNYFDKSLMSNNLQHLLDTNNVEGKVFPLNRFLQARNGADTTSSFTGYDNTRTEFQATDIQGSDLTYLFKNKNNASGILLPAENILGPVFQSQKTELFESYLLVDKKNGLIYKDPALSIVSNIPIDSLLPHSNALFASVRDIKIEDVDYKLFSYPLHFGNDDVFLCGLIKTKDYNERLHEIPVAFIYPIVIAFLLLLIFLPIIKFYLIGDGETVRFIDITLSAISFIVGPALLTLILIQVLLLWSADLRAKSNLDLLTRQIDSAFTKDIVNAYTQLDTLDSLVSGEDSAKIAMKEKNSNANVSSQIISYFKTHKGEAKLDYNFDRIFWIDSLGKQKIKGQVGDDELLFTNVATRKYFRIFKHDSAYLLPGHPEALFGFEPVTSWADGEFRIIISKKSRFKNGSIVAVATKMPSVTQTILPPGFGFCVIDNAGKVQLHSEMNRNLQENIIDKMSPSRPVKEAIASRQASYFNNLKFYGKTNAASITPISKDPFFLITFYDKGYIVPITMRIFTFALLFCLLSFLIYFLIWMLVFRKHYYVNPMLYSPMVFLKWAIPKKESFQFYILGRNFLTGYILMLLLFMALSGYFGISNYVILVLVLLTPVNVISSLFVISYSTIKQDVSNETKRARNLKKKAIKAIIFQLISSLLVYFYSFYYAYPIEGQFLLFQGIFNVAMWAFYFSPAKRICSISKSKKYLSHYAGLSTTLILSLAVLPAGLYTWYAHNQEITQSVKKGQLYFAESVQKRTPSIIKFAKHQSILDAPPDYFKKLQYQSGIYTIYSDVISRDVDSVPLRNQKESYEQFYFAIANDIGNNYYDPLLLPALKDSASDEAWRWSRSGTALFFKYTLPENFSPGDNTNGEAQPLKIISVFPARYMFVGMTFRGILLLIVIILLTRGLYMILLSLVNRVFLKKYIDAIESKSFQETTGHLIDEFITTYKKIYPEFEGYAKKLTTEYDYFTPVAKNKIIYKQEKDIIDVVKKLKPFYDFIWQKCSEKEKYLLFDFAKDSLVNYKNIEPIYGLLEKGLFIIHDFEIKLFSPSFRAYVLEKNNSPEMYQMQKKFQQNSTWQSFRIPILVILLGIALFIFFTQEETFQKLTAIVAGVSSVLSLLLKFFVDGGSPASAKK